MKNIIFNNSSSCASQQDCTDRSENHNDIQKDAITEESREQNHEEKVGFQLIDIDKVFAN